MDGIKPHEAPISRFPEQPSGKDGLGRMCKPHWTEYTHGLRTAALEREAVGAATTESKAKNPTKGSPKSAPAQP